MSRPRILTDDQRKERKKISNNKPEYVEYRRQKALEYYYKKKLEKIEIVEIVQPEIKQPEIQK